MSKHTVRVWARILYFVDVPLQWLCDEYGIPNPEGEDDEESWRKVSEVLEDATEQIILDHEDEFFSNAEIKFHHADVFEEAKEVSL